MLLESVDARLSLSQGFSSTDLTSHLVKDLRLQASANGLVFQTATVSIPTTPTTLDIDVSDFASSSPNYLVVQSISGTGVITVSFKDESGGASYVLVRAGALVILPKIKPVSGSLVKLTSSSSNVAHVCAWGPK